MLMTERERLTNEIETLAEKHQRKRTALIPIIQEIKRNHHKVDGFAMQMIADQLGIHPAEVHSVASFYAFLGSEAHGKYIIRLCRTISCDMLGKDRIKSQLENELGIKFGQTTVDGKFSLEWANCMGMCDQGPAMLVNDKLHTKVTAEKVHQIIEECRRTFSAHSMEKKEAHLA